MATTTFTGPRLDEGQGSEKIYQPAGYDRMAEHIMENPDKGAGIMFPAVSHALGISLQLSGVTVVLTMLSLLNAEFLNAGTGAILIPTAAFVGAITTFVGGMWNLYARNMIAGVIGGLYGAFFLTLSFILKDYKTGIVAFTGAEGFGDALGALLLVMGVISIGISFATFFVNRMVFTQQCGVTAVFLLLGWGDAFAHPDAVKVAGYVGLATAALTVYLVTAFLANDTAGRVVLPLR